MTVLQKKTDNPIAHLSADDIEEIGRRLDAIRAEIVGSRGAGDAAYIRRVIKVQRSLELSISLYLTFATCCPMGSYPKSNQADASIFCGISSHR
jgi:hypothetical protein